MFNSQFKTVQGRLTSAVLKYPALEKYLTAYNKELWYFNDQFKEYTKLFSDETAFEKKFADDYKNQIPGLNSASTQNLDIKQPFNSAYANYSTDGLQTNSDVRLAQQSMKKLLADNGNKFSQSLKPVFQDVSKLKSYSKNVSVGKNFKVNPYKSKRFVDRIDKTINLQPQFTNQYHEFYLCFIFQLEYKINLRSSAGIGISSRHDFSSINKVTHFSNSISNFNDHIFFDYWLITAFHAYGEYQPFKLITNSSSEIAKTTPQQTKSPKQGDISFGVRIKLLQGKKASDNFYLLYVFPKNGSRPYWQYRFGLTF